MNIVLNDVLVVLVGILGVFFLFKTYDIYVGIILFLIETILAGIAWYFGVTSSVLVVFAGVLLIYIPSCFGRYTVFQVVSVFLIEMILAGIAWYFGVTSSVLVKVFVILCLVFPIVSYVYVIVFDPDPKMIVKIGYVLTLLVFLVLILLLSFSL